MHSLDLGRSVRKVTLVQSDGAVVILHRGKKSKKKRKSSREMKPLEKAVRKMSDANLAGAKSYSKRHKRSSRKKKDGWAKDLPKNLSKSSDKAWKKL